MQELKEIVFLYNNIEEVLIVEDIETGKRATVTSVSDIRHFLHQQYLSPDDYYSGWIDGDDVLDLFS
ncbi:hypothetical protein [Shimazuella kribbensis]|uniref:hypothetical protein n=1 Tax=Shimazuella kribbensis TaxID=139808 RepID=UPI0003F7AC3D|nr:hypothetical protein [Shimazuella kribbensis]